MKKLKQTKRKELDSVYFVEATINAWISEAFFIFPPSIILFLLPSSSFAVIAHLLQ